MPVIISCQIQDHFLIEASADFHRHIIGRGMAIPSLLQEEYQRHSSPLSRGLLLVRSKIPWQTGGRQVALGA